MSERVPSIAMHLYFKKLEIPKQSEGFDSLLIWKF